MRGSLAAAQLCWSQVVSSPRVAWWGAFSLPRCARHASHDIPVKVSRLSVSLCHCFFFSSPLPPFVFTRALYVTLSHFREQNNKAKHVMSSSSFSSSASSSSSCSSSSYSSFSFLFLMRLASYICFALLRQGRRREDVSRGEEE